MIRENQKYLNRGLVVIDALSIILALILSWVIRFKSGIINIDEWSLTFWQYLFPLIFIIPLYLFIYSLFNLYTPHRVRKSTEELISIIKSNVVGVLIFILALYVFKVVDYSRYLILTFSIICIVFTFVERLIMRLILRKLRKKGYNLKHIIIVGLSDMTYELISKLGLNSQWGYNIIGILDDNVEIGNIKINNSQRTGLNNLEQQTASEVAATMEYIQGAKIMGKIGELQTILNEINVDEIFITLKLKEYNKIGNVISICEKMGIRVQIIPGYYKYIPAKPYLEDMDGLPMINLRYVPLDNILNNFIKRSFDIVFSIISIIVFSPIIIVTSLIMKITSPGPIIFKQERIGQGRKPFTMYKFRSMKIQSIKEEVNQWTSKEDSRKTKFGSFIRKTSIDELPQLFNVLKGDMSLIGPRPERPFFVEKFKEEIPKYMVKHHVRPGMTGWAQVNGWRGDTSINKRIEYDIYYIENWSITIDIKILWLTIYKGFINRNAY
ncbi:undecaprenyl-phosphate glucose phosphotransferase [Clostridium estertheticum]|uniref:undecaprenyl-phosphate glucose phosphotransferase n=1 Tax=Clostridium estertheticum TaxID=238834 RepID=UPI001C7D3FCF|nr:undecaprenyl-phosphate glucose phosphotransferase [Clostridium estertheticum]MBX4258438.1 undecaprenyl-phosphate glucose phosphotransferase [Clostridium estertheticum]WLC69610.1 undecaprenyl-phosphate glucose phosphotransferase [Clostridium estertheticum]